MMKSLKKAFITLIAFAWILQAAQAAEEHAMPQMGRDHAMPQMAGKTDNMPLSEGEIRKVDKSAGKLTIKHGHLANLDMPPMTMVFRVQDPAMLDKVKPGDKIRFIAERINGALTITMIEAVKP